MIIIKVDILGSGLSGLSTAISLKKHNKAIRVIIHEKNKKIGYNREGRRCGELFLLREDQKHLSPERNSIYNEIEYTEWILGNKKYVFPISLGTYYVLNKPEFICQLARKAERIGVEIQTGDTIKSITDLTGDFIVDASGCPSSIKRELNLNQGYQGFGYQQTLENYEHFSRNRYKIIFNGENGYYWIFPRNPIKKEINVGVGIFGTRISNLKKMLEKFKEEEDIDGKINYVTSGLIPLGLQEPLIYRNILFVGDAGVGTHPLTGQGNRRAIISGELAGFFLASRCPKKYPSLINEKFFKQDLLGKMILKGSLLINKIGKKAVLIMINNLVRLDKAFNFYKTV